MEAVTGSNTLLDLLGTLIGFSTVMLLLSLVVTAIVQVIQSALQLRAKNLARGIAMALEDKGFAESESKALDLAKKLLVRPTSKDRNDTTKVPKFRQMVSWLDLEKREVYEQLYGRLKKLVPEKTTDAAVAKFAYHFDALSSHMSKRFGWHSRVVSLICAAFVAGLFQVNALDLFRDLSVNSALRAQYLVASEQVMATVDTEAMTVLTYQEISDLALSQLAVKHPEIDSVFDEVSGVGGSKEEMVGELRTVLAAATPDRADDLATEYQELLDKFYTDQADRALERVDNLTTQLAHFNVTLWPHGLRYFGDWNNIFGCLITLALISLGAPFWYRWIGILSNLRDALKPSDKAKDKDKDKDKEGQPAPPVKKFPPPENAGLADLDDTVKPKDKDDKDEADKPAKKFPPPANVD